MIVFLSKTRWICSHGRKEIFHAVRPLSMKHSTKRVFKAIKLFPKFSVFHNKIGLLTKFEVILRNEDTEV
jgi:hypothetical protein